MFEAFEGVPHYPDLEEKIRRFWEDQEILRKLQEQNQDGPRWDFQDGPITANNRMGVHHAWGRTYKDAFNRYHSMRGQRLRWQNGFDCQGLWVEVEVEKSLGFNGKEDILEFGLEEFSKACRERVEKFAGVITEQSKRLGMWNDWERSYYTFDDSNIEHIWLFLKKCHDEGWLAQDYRVMPWCPRCETSLSQHESADSYKDVTHRSVYIKLPIVERPGENFLVWTTTPWTLTANVALALNPELTYVRAKSEGDILILSEGTVETALREGYEVLDTIKGSELIGLTYSGPFDDLPVQVEMNAVTPRRTVAWEDVGEAEGTGIVHIAPGCGAEDFELGKRENLGLIAPVQQNAHFIKETGEFAGLHALDDAEKIFEGLRERDRLYRIQKYLHSYPHCWRCGHELIFYATKEWFIRADAGDNPARPRLREAAKTVNWVPDYAGKRMDDWLVNMGDWCISRKRFWGLPLPIFGDEEGEHFEIIGSRAELRERAVDPALVDALPELHRPWIDEIKIYSADRTKVLSRVPEVGDAWLDAGIVPFATRGYNGAKDIRNTDLAVSDKADWQPADFISEMREQVRLWFFSMLFMSVALEDRAPYKTAMVYETMLDENGERISKTKKNGVPYDEAVEKVGADPMRWTFCGNPVNKDIRFGYKPIHESQRKLITLWNVYSFFVTYANLDKPDLSQEITDPQNVLDRWILARLQQLIEQVTNAFENIAPSEATASVEQFVEVLSNWYVRRSRRRFWKSDSDEDKQQAYQTLHKVLLTLCKLIAPVIPFTAESMYQNLKKPLKNDHVDGADTPLKSPLEGGLRGVSAESVHLESWPIVDSQLRNNDLIHEVDDVLLAVSLGHAARKDSKIKVRQPLGRALIFAPTPPGRQAVANWHDTILDELNVKEIEMLEGTGDLVSYSLRANLPKLGPKYGKQIGAIRKTLESASPEVAAQFAENAKADKSTFIEVNGEQIELTPDEILIDTHQQSGYQFATDNGWAVALDTTLNDGLIVEGLARDLVRAIQNARKDSGFDVSDHITILMVDDDKSRLPELLEHFGDYIQQETLADELRFVDAKYPELREATIGSDENAETLRFNVEKIPASELTE